MNQTNQPLLAQVVLITGVTQGLGEQLALDCASQGATVVLMGRKTKKLEKLYDRIVNAGWPEPLAIEMDFLTVTDDMLMRCAFDIHKALGRLDVIIHSAAYFYALSRLADQRIDDWMNQYRINTVVPFALTRACLPMLAAAPQATVIFVGETHGQQPKAYWGGFGASKAGLYYLSQVAADEWDQHPKVNVYYLVPGPIHSPQRLKTHPGEDKTDRILLDDVLPFFRKALSVATPWPSGSVIDCAACLNQASHES